MRLRREYRTGSIGRCTPAVRLGRDGGIGSVERGIFTDRVAVIVSISEQHIWANIVGLQLRIIGRCVRGFAWREDEAKRKAVVVRAGMDFTREAATRAAKTLILSPLSRRLLDGGRRSRCCRSFGPLSAQRHYRPTLLEKKGPTLPTSSSAETSDTRCSACQVPRDDRGTALRYASPRKCRPACAGDLTTIAR